MSDAVAEPGWAVAFGAGVVSFLSPCVAPLAPGYLAYIAGVSFQGGANSRRKDAAHILSTSLLFMLGFTFVFVMLGTSVSFATSFLQEHRQTLNQVAGAMMIVLGLLIAGVVRLPLLYQERRFHVSDQALGPAAPVLLGMVFAFAWTPCLTPVLGSILLYASTAETAGRGGLLLFVYSLGFGLPFVLAGLGLASALRVVSWARRHYGVINAISGAVMVAIGVLLLMGEWSSISLWTERTYHAVF